jgi:hypothetical protein
MIPRSVTVLFFGLAIFASTVAQADTIAIWSAYDHGGDTTVEGGQAGPPADTIATAADVTGDGLSQAPNWAPQTGLTRGGKNGIAASFGGNSPTTWAEAISLGTYFTFGFSTTGDPWDLDQIQIRTYIQNDPTTAQFELQYSTDGSTWTSLGAQTLVADPGYNTWDASSVDNVTDIDFRLAALLDSAGSYLSAGVVAEGPEGSEGAFWQAPGDSDDLIVTGTLVPEPASMALLGLGGLALIRRRRN